jgi:hypothetical protein
MRAWSMSTALFRTPAIVCSQVRRIPAAAVNSSPLTGEDSGGGESRRAESRHSHRAAVWTSARSPMTAQAQKESLGSSRQIAARAIG